MKKHRTRQPNILIIDFDDARTRLDIITKALREGNFPVEGKPVYLDVFPDDNQSR